MAYWLGSLTLHSAVHLGPNQQHINRYQRSDKNQSDPNNIWYFHQYPLQMMFTEVKAYVGTGQYCSWKKHTYTHVFSIFKILQIWQICQINCDVQVDWIYLLVFRM